MATRVKDGPNGPGIIGNDGTFYSVAATARAPQSFWDSLGPITEEPAKDAGGAGSESPQGYGGGMNDYGGIGTYDGQGNYGAGSESPNGYGMGGNDYGGYGNYDGSGGFGGDSESPQGYGNDPNQYGGAGSYDGMGGWVSAENGAGYGQGGGNGGGSYGGGYGGGSYGGGGNGGGGGSYGIGSGSSWRVGGGRTGGQPTMQGNNGYANQGGNQTMGQGGNQPLGSTVQGAPSFGQMGGGFDPNGPRNPFNQAKPWNGGPQSMFGQTGFQPGMQGNPQTMSSQNGFNPNGNGPVNPFLTMSGFRQGGIGQPPTEAYNRYQGMLKDPTSMSANPAYKAIMDAATQATERQQLARGGNGGGTILAELAKTGASVAGQFLPQMANMYRGGSQEEIGNWQAANQGNLAAGQLGGNLYGAQNQANLGYGSLGNQMYANQGQVNLGYGNLANNMWNNAANNQYLLGNAYGQMQNGAANTQGAALAQAQLNPANNYYQNQLTMQRYG